MKHIGTQNFETARLICRPFKQEDCNDMLENWIADPDVQLEYGEPVYTDISQVKGVLADYIKNYQKPDFDLAIQGTLRYHKRTSGTPLTQRSAALC